MKKGFLLIPLLILSLATVNFTTTAVPGDSPATAVTAVLGSNNGSIQTVNTAFYFNFSAAAASDFYELALYQPSGAEFSITIYDANNTFIASSTLKGNPHKMVIFGYEFYIIRIYSVVGTGNFTLDISLTMLPEVFEGKNSGNVTFEGDNAYFLFYGMPGVGYNFLLYGDPATDFDLVVYDDLYTVIDNSRNTGYPENVYGVSPSGVFVIRVESVVGYGLFDLEIISSQTPPPPPSNEMFLGDNYVENINESQTLEFVFKAEPGGNYDFFLNANDSTTDFNLELYDFNGNFLGGSYSATYPEKVSVVNAPPEIFINVIALIGSGSFTVTIVEVTQPPMPIFTEAFFSQYLAKGDHYTWSMVSGQLGETDIVAGDNVTLNINENGDQVKLDAFTFTIVPANAFEIEHKGHLEEGFFIFMFVIPVTLKYADGSTGSVKDFLAMMFDTDPSKLQENGGQVGYVDIDTEIWFDTATGLMTTIKTPEFEFGLITSITLTTLPGDNNTTDTALPTPDLASLPISPLQLLVALIAMPILRRRE